MWESSKTVALTTHSVIIRPDVDDNFVINSTHLKMIWEYKFDGYLRTDPYDHISEFLAICDMFKYGETQSEAVKLLIFPSSLWDEAKTCLLLKIRIEPTQAILDGTAKGIFLYKSSNQAFQFIKDKVLFKLNWFTKSKIEHHRKCVYFADGSNSNNDNSRLMKKLEALTIKKDSRFTSLKEELQDMRKKYDDLRYYHASKSRLNDDTPMCERHEVNYIQSECYQNRDSRDSYSHQSYYNKPQSNDDSKKSLIELNNDVKNNLEYFKRCIRSMRTVHDKLFDRDDQSKTDLEKSITKFLDDQRVSNMFVKNNINDIIIKMEQNEKNCQTIYKNMEIKIAEWSKSQNVSSEQTDRAEPPPPHQARIEHVNSIFTGSGKSGDYPKIQKDPPPPITVNNKIEKDKPIKTSKRAITRSKQKNIHSINKQVELGWL
ncbi:hypothetical protein Tco_0524879 [Tanacetum coccineum]